MATATRPIQLGLLWGLRCALLVVPICAATPLRDTMDVTAGSQWLPAGVQLPSAWALTPMMPATETLGLTLHLFHLNAPIAAVKRWAAEPHAGCDASPATPYQLGAPILLWLCIESSRMYSIVSADDGLLWAVSVRAQAKGQAAADSFTTMLLATGAVQVQHSSNAFESVDVYHTPRSLLALQRDFERYREGQGGSLLAHNRVANGLTLSWQQGAVRTHVSAIHQGDGQVVVTRVMGTNL